MIHDQTPICIECRDAHIIQEVVQRLGAWHCPIHRDLGHVDFVTMQIDTSPKTAGEALKRLEAVLRSSAALSQDFQSSVMGWAYKAVELADKKAREEYQ